MTKENMNGKIRNTGKKQQLNVKTVFDFYLVEVKNFRNVNDVNFIMKKEKNFFNEQYT